jgi:hypothetical protein
MNFWHPMGNLALKVLQAVISKEQNSPWYLTKNMVSNISFRRYKTQWGSVYKHCNFSQYFLANPRQSIQNLLQNLEIIQNCLVSSFWITRVLFHITRYVPPAEKWKSQAQNHIYTSVDHPQRTTSFHERTVDSFSVLWL